jgi:hypoxanthine phosphoribosyltransferase
VLRGLGFEGKDIQHLGMTSYEPNSTERQNGEFQIGQKPDPKRRGGHWAIVDEVGETVESLAVARDIIVNEYDAQVVTTGVLIDKPSKHSERGLSPDFFVAQTDRWVVFPMEVYDVIGKLKREHVGRAALREVMPKIKEIWRLPEHGAVRNSENGLVVVGEAIGSLTIPEQIEAPVAVAL